MPATIECRGLRCAFPTGGTLALNNVTFSLRAGSVTLLIGQSGAGKSTLLHALAGLLADNVQVLRQGEIIVAGHDPQRLPAARRAGLVGLVQQSPDTQICTTTVESEVAFGLENLAIESSEIDRRINEALLLVGLQELRQRYVTQLSGGQRQRLVLAAVLAIRPEVLLLDEPLSQLDPGAAAQFLAAIDNLPDGGPTIVVAEHRAAAWRERADQLLVLDEGRLMANLPSEDYAAWDVEFRRLRAQETPVHSSCTARSAPLVEVDRLTFTFDRRRAAVLSDVTFRAHAGERIALLGANGSGKSTLLAILAGLHEPQSGTLKFLDTSTVGLVRQNPDTQLFCRSVREELACAPRHAGCPRDEIAERVCDAAERFELTRLLDRSPLHLSQGERLRVAVAATFTMRAPMMLLDEPTTGQDPRHEAQLMHTLAEAVAAAGPPQALIFSTHDLQVAKLYADRVIVLDEGRIIADGAPEPAIEAFEACLRGLVSRERGP